MNFGLRKPGALILKEEPFVHVLSNKERGLRCDECLGVSNDLKRCSGCKFARFCSTSCQKKSWIQHKVECRCIQRVAPKIPTDSVRLLLRLVQKYEDGSHTCKSKSQRCFWDLISHSKEIKEDPLRTEQFSQMLRTLTTLTCNELVLPPSGVLFEIFGKMTINTFSICDQEMQPIAVGLYVLASALDHSCQPNAVAVFQGKEISVRLVENLPSNATLSDVRISYIDQLAPSMERQKQLEEQYYFTCVCPMCQDKEMDLLMTSSCCPSPGCKRAVIEEKGIIRACRSCGDVISDIPSHRESKAEVQANSQSTLQTIEHAKKAKDYDRVLRLCEDCLETQTGVLHPLNIHRLRILDQAFDACIELQIWDKALQYGLATLDAYRKYYHSSHPNVGLQLMKIAKIQLYLQKYQQAMQHFTTADAIISITHGKDHPLLVELRSLISQTTEEMMVMQEMKKEG